MQSTKFSRGLHQPQYPLYANPAAAAAMSQIERERLGISGHHVGLDPSDPMVNPKQQQKIKSKISINFSSY